jgi:hypothetical protein
MLPPLEMVREGLVFAPPNRPPFYLLKGWGTPFRARVYSSSLEYIIVTSHYVMRLGSSAEMRSKRTNGLLSSVTPLSCRHHGPELPSKRWRSSQTCSSLFPSSTRCCGTAS